jgi:hypothetical protein
MCAGHQPREERVPGAANLSFTSEGGERGADAGQDTAWTRRWMRPVCKGEHLRAAGFVAGNSAHRGQMSLRRMMGDHEKLPE